MQLCQLPYDIRYQISLYLPLRSRATLCLTSHDHHTAFNPLLYRLETHRPNSQTLFRAIRRDNRPAVNHLLLAGANLEPHSSNYKRYLGHGVSYWLNSVTPLHLAVMYHPPRFHLAKVLLKNGACIGRRLIVDLLNLSNRPHPDAFAMVRYLLAYLKRTPDRRDEFTDILRTMLVDRGRQWYVSLPPDLSGKLRLLVLEGLLQAGADPDVQGGLVDAVKRGDLEVVGLLLRYGADPDRRDGEGRTAADIAVWKGPREAAVLLKKHMRNGGRYWRPKGGLRKVLK